MPVSETEAGNFGTALLVAEKAVRDHQQLRSSEMQTQGEAADRMWVLSQRYTILVNGRQSDKTDSFPIEASHRVEDEIKSEFHSKLCILTKSNSKLTLSLANVKNAARELQMRLCPVEADSFHMADAIQQPDAFYVELFNDFTNFFSRTQCKLSGYVILLSLDNATSVERYKALLKSNKDFDEHCYTSLSYCSCLRTLEIKKP